MKQVLRTFGMLALLSVTAMAQNPPATTGNNMNPINIMWWIFTMLYGIFGAMIGIAILWHCGKAALGNHDGFERIVNVVMFGAIGFAATYIISKMVLGVASPI